MNGNYEAAIILECDSIQRTRLEGLDRSVSSSASIITSAGALSRTSTGSIPQPAPLRELVYRLAREAGVSISPEIATCLYTALLTDTGSFMFEGTNEHTFALARELVMAGADPAACARNIYFAHSTAKMRLLGAALSQLASRRTTGLDMGHARANGSRRAQGRRLRRPGELRTGDLRRRSGRLLS